MANEKNDLEVLIGRKPIKYEDWAIENISLFIPQDEADELTQEDEETDRSKSFVIKKEMVGPKKCLLQVQVISKHLEKSFPKVLGENLSRSFSRQMKKCLHMDPQACSVVIKRERNCAYYTQEKCQTFVLLCTVFSWQGAVPPEIQEKIRANIQGIVAALVPDESEPLLEIIFLSL